MASIYYNTWLSMHTLQFNGFEITLTRKRIKNINLRIDREGNVTVSAPLRCSLRRIQSFVEDKHDWITTHRDRLLAKPVHTDHQFDTGELQRYLGTLYPLQIHETTLRPRIVFETTHISCYIKAHATSEMKKAALQHWHRAQMNLLLPDLIKKWEPVIGVQVAEWGVKAMKTRWGSCNTMSHRIWINLFLIHEPIQCLEYVLVHEMVHLLEASHNKRFYALMSKFLPGWQECRQKLRHSSPRLQ